MYIKINIYLFFKIIFNIKISKQLENIKKKFKTKKNKFKKIMI